MAALYHCGEYHSKIKVWIHDYKLDQSSWYNQIEKSEENKMRVYLDTSVFSVFYDQRAPERMQATKEFWDVLKP
ncbi:MAG: hypothetical protein HY257_05205 [Chloroflexi bacterium]|nr:hypothetical protein [Chloroflexota bacterium]